MVVEIFSSFQFFEQFIKIGISSSLKVVGFISEALGNWAFLCWKAFGDSVSVLLIGLVGFSMSLYLSFNILYASYPFPLGFLIYWHIPAYDNCWLLSVFVVSIVKSPFSPLIFWILILLGYFGQWFINFIFQKLFDILCNLRTILFSNLEFGLF